jgi:sugar lactone lactonase YvrE
MRTSILAPVVALVLSLSTAGARQPEITRYPLPAEITYPEGIAYDQKTNTVFTGSAETWAIARMSPDTKQASIVAPAGQFPGEPFPALLGMKADQAGRLWLAGGRTGLMAVVDARTGKEIARFEVPTSGKSLINDVVVLDSGAYYTDTLVPTLWRIPVHGDHIGPLEPWLDLTGTAIEYDKGANLNGIAATADGRYLVVVQMNKGLLFRIGTGDRQVTPIDTGGEALNTADGLVLDGRTLYVVRQGEQEVVTIELSEDLSKARVVNRFRDPALAWPATAAKVGNQLLVVNTQFNQRQAKQAETPFTIVGIPLSRLAGK